MIVYLLCLVLLPVATVATLATVTNTPPHPNILFFLVDDGGFESPVWGNPVISTPHISALAHSGTLFQRAYTAVSSCSPSRSAILSGLPTHQNGMYGLHQNPGNFQSNADITSVPNLLNQAGYKTGIIGKHHVGPLANFNFTYGTDASYCWAGALGNPMNFGNDVTCHAEYNQVTRNLTNMKLNTREFLSLEPTQPFFLYIGFGDVHRCKYKSPIGSFCEFYGSGKTNQGMQFPTIEDWPTPAFYTPAEVIVPPYLPDTDSVREDIAGQYTAWDRLDTGVGVIMNELTRAKVLNTTLVVFFSDNGIPFPAAKTNLFEVGQHEPLIVSTPSSRSEGVGHTSEVVVSSLDLAPTLLDWAGVAYPRNARARGAPAHLTGKSLLPLLKNSGKNREDKNREDKDREDKNREDKDRKDEDRAAYGSHQFHSLYAYYPMRSMVTTQYRLIHNLNYNLKYPILEDVFGTDTWTDIERLGEQGNDHPNGWALNYTTYMFRPEWQLFDVVQDPLCLDNLALNGSFAKTLRGMQGRLRQWQQDTSDPWLGCNPAVPNGLSKQEEWSTTHSETCSF